MKSKLTLLSVLISASLLASTSLYAGGNGRGPGASTPGRSGQTVTPRGNPKSTGTPLKDGSGKTTAPGKGAKDGTGTRANCPNK
ncbi:MAG: hypothetical protein HYV95_14410 [Opitutae bacterium]|nr:hypothetical protein [Opitutae bacterium]